MTQPSERHAPTDPIDEAARTWFLRLTSGAVAQQDLARFKAWRAENPRHAAAFDEVRAVWNDAEGLRTAFASPGTPLTADSRRGRLNGRRSLVVGRRGVAIGGLIAAAMTLYVASALDLPLRWKADHRTGIGQQAEVTLPDGSLAVLNTDSAISIDFSGNARQVSLLRGEVWFEAAKDPRRPFEVLALQGKATALGTEFVVQEGAGIATVTVNEGAVRVTAPVDSVGTGPAASSVTLGAGDRVKYREGAAPGPVQRANLASTKSWRQGLIVIEGAPFAEAIAQIGRYHAGRIILLTDTASLQPVSARLSLTAIDSGLDAMAATHGLKVTRMTRYVTIIH